MIPVCSREGQRVSEFKASLGYIIRPYPNNNKKQKQTKLTSVVHIDFQYSGSWT